MPVDASVKNVDAVAGAHDRDRDILLLMMMTSRRRGRENMQEKSSGSGSARGALAGMHSPLTNMMPVLRALHTTRESLSFVEVLHFTPQEFHPLPPRPVPCPPPCSIVTVDIPPPPSCLESATRCPRQLPCRKPAPPSVSASPWVDLLQRLAYSCTDP